MKQKNGGSIPLILQADPDVGYLKAGAQIRPRATP